MSEIQLNVSKKMAEEQRELPHLVVYQEQLEYLLEQSKTATAKQ
nr:hypothetical protein [uncultured Roseibium sp.]